MSQPEKRQFNALPALSALVFSSPAIADGLGGLSAMGLLLFVFTSIAPVLMMVSAAMISISAPSKGNRFAGASMALGVIYVLWGLAISDASFPASLNPWLGGDVGAVATICIVLIVGNLLVACQSWKSRGYLAGVAVVFIALQWTMAPGNAFYYEHDPVDVETENVRVLNKNYVEWNDRLIYSEPDIPFRFQGRPAEVIQAIVERDEGGRYAVVTVEPNRDPRLESRNSYEKENEFWFPVQPSHRLANVVESGELLPEDWQADSNLLLEAATSKRSGDWIRFLVEHGADLDYVDENGNSALRVAVDRGNPVALRLLLELGADPNVDLGRGYRVLHYAAREADNNDSGMLNLLLDHGADPTIQNDDRRTVAGVFYAHLNKRGRTPAAKEYIKEAWARVLENQ